MRTLVSCPFLSSVALSHATLSQKSQEVTLLQLALSRHAVCRGHTEESHACRRRSLVDGGAGVEVSVIIFLTALLCTNCTLYCTVLYSLEVT